jgi:hypothetical protein
MPASHFTDGKAIASGDTSIYRLSEKYGNQIQIMNMKKTVAADVRRLPTHVIHKFEPGYLGSYGVLKEAPCLEIKL